MRIPFVTFSGHILLVTVKKADMEASELPATLSGEHNACTNMESARALVERKSMPSGIGGNGERKR